ncbi:hypothetical protein BD324DRAFT_603887 [Kockovaella imperatae]|uniref:CRAL-TRIO domain-containing protein n=1 Tax=Kockovaella imperatae TaxID=4999 RepID=A0A1Y1UAI2_9TREE|nr:hypothetical protein BD324DRAFT_603887 [Kockovaella imperatae]ORX35043.1 hypothetical protein BD324DRAFT_603887 [Kockovaella imperatae]
MTTASSSTLRPFEKRFKASQKQYTDHLETTERLQAQLRLDADELGAQAGWDPATLQGVNAWLDDKACIFRFLKRNGYDERKAYSAILTALANRATHSLHQPLPSIPPYSTSPLFYLLPLPRFTDKVGRPIVILTAKEVKRDSHGSMQDLSQWIWWGAEMLRRTLRDHWVKGKWTDGKTKAEGGEGCVLIIDAGGSSYRNLEVELVPIFNVIGSKNFPGMIESAFVINAGWVQRSLWSILRPILPKPAVERISLVDKTKDMGEVFDLDRLPQIFGGRDPWKWAPEDNPVLAYYQSHALTPDKKASPCLQPGSLGSFSSTAEVFYTANNTPISSRRTSRRSSRVIDRSSIVMTKAEEAQGDRIDIVAALQQAGLVDNGKPQPVSQASTTTGPSRAMSTSSLIFPSAIERVKSLADFHLYLSPSRLAQIDGLSDISDDAPHHLELPAPIPHRMLRPAFLNPQIPITVNYAAARPLRPPLRTMGIPGHIAQDDHVRSYSTDLMRHHAKSLVKLDTDAAIARTKSTLGNDVNKSAQESQETVGEDEQPSPSDPADPELGSQPNVTHPISAFSRSSNPFYGYPAVRVSDINHPGQSAIVPQYPRRRKRDLVRTLLFLFLVRLQSWRVFTERSLGLHRLIRSTPAQRLASVTNPSQGLIMEARQNNSRAVSLRKKWDADWIWMGIVFVIMRGAWGRLISGPLEAVGLSGFRDFLGLH